MEDIRAFIFDLDGVITDTSEFHYRSWQRLADEEGFPFTRADNEQLRGVSRRESLIRLLKGRQLPEEQMQTLMKRKNAYFQAYLEELTPANCLPGVVPFLDAAKRGGIRIGIGSASKNARVVLDRLGLLDVFDAIGDGYSVVNPKPAPDIFVWVAGGLGVSVAQSIVFEDAEAGIDAAKTAGCYSIGIGSANVTHADIVLPDLSEITVKEIMVRIREI